MNKTQHDFPFDLPVAGKFPLPRLQAAVQECINARQVPVKMPYYTAAGAYTAAAQMLVDMDKPRGGLAGANLYFLVSAPPGSRKTEVRRDFFRALEDVANQLDRQFEQAMACYEEQDYLWSRTEMILSAAARRKGQDAEAAQAQLAEHYQRKPIRSRKMVVSMKEPNYASLMRALTDYPCTTIVSGDCAAYLRQTILPIDTQFCDIWSGEKIDDPRVSVASYYRENPRLTMFLMIQLPSLMRFWRVSPGKELSMQASSIA